MAIIDAALTFIWVLTLGIYLGMLWVRRAPQEPLATPGPFWYQGGPLPPANTKIKKP